MIKPVISIHVSGKHEEKSQSHAIRSVSSTDKAKLKEQLILYKEQLIEQVSPVGIANIFLEH